MIATLSMYALVALGYAQVNMALAVMPLALLNTFIDLPKPQQTSDTAPTPSTCAALNRALPRQMVYTSLAYLMGVAVSFYV